MPYKRKGSKYWQISVNGARESSGTTDYGRAKTLEHKLNNEAWDSKKLGIKFRTWDQACLDYLQRKRGLKSIGNYAQYAKFWQAHFSGKSLRSITCDTAREILSPTVNVEEATPQNTTANLKLGFVGKVMRHAKAQWEPQYYPEPNGREEWLTVAQWLSLTMPEDLRQVATFSLATGLREANVIGLQWDWVRGDSVIIPAEFAKTARPYGIPLNATAMSVLRERRESPVIDARSAFRLQGRAIYRVQLGRLWKRVLLDAGVPHMPYHGLRHTYASWMVQAGVPFEIVARLGQWKLQGMVHRYSHFDVESLRQWAERFDTFLAQSKVKSLGSKAIA